MFNKIKILDKKDYDGKSDLEILKIGTDMLVESGFSTIKLFDEISNVIDKYGPYFVFDNGVSVAHAAPGEYCKETGASLFIIKEGKEIFGKNIKIFVTLSVPEDGDHMELLQKVIQIVGKKESQEEILNYSSKDEK